ncbi:hypothetical protein R75465_08106 [Paraburkholderia aspalathi]|nr:hypothetical protein R75465_08106 [Paraburkholderia aspalathi]
MTFGLGLVQFADLNLRGQQRGGALLKRGLGATQLIAGGNDRLLCLDLLRLEFGAQRVERRLR